MSTEISAVSLDTVENATRKFINKIVAAGGTRAGACEIAADLDPFHDCALPEARGWPDGTGALSVTQVVKLQSTVNKPSGISTPGWDLHIVNLPWLSPINLTGSGVLETNQYGGGTFHACPLIIVPGVGPTFMGVGGLSVFMVPEGTDLLNITGGTTYPYFSLTPPDIYLNGDYRVDATAFECRSVGPDLYKSGTVNCWQSPVTTLSNKLDSTYYNYASGVSNGEGFSDTLFFDCFPTNDSQAVLKTDSVTFGAKEGCYVVSRKNTINPPKTDQGGISPCLKVPSGYFTPILSSASNGVFSTALSANVQAVTYTPANGSSSVNTSYVPACDWCAFNMAGAQLLGLSDTDQITITVKWRITRYPSVNQPDLLVLAKLHPEYDPVSIRMYSEAMEMLPIGVPVRMNSIGEWFRDVASSISSVAAPILSALPSPYAKAAGAVLTGVNSVTGKKQKKEKKIVKKENKIEKKEKSLEKKIDMNSQKIANLKRNHKK